MIEIKNDCSENNIPSELKTLISQVIEIYKNIFGDKLVAVYIAGSIPRGNFTKGKSDADFYAVVDIARDELHSEELSKNLANLELSWQGKGLTTIDGEVITTNEIHSLKKRRTAFILHTDSILIFGRKQNFMFAVPDSSKELATLLNGLAKKRLRKIEVRLAAGTSEAKDINRITKLTIRCAFGVALIRGATYSPAYKTYPAAISKYVPELTPVINSVLEESSNSKYPTSRMINAAEQAISLAEDLGVHFA
jgi:predicted nucleotidyltransferase